MKRRTSSAAVFVLGLVLAAPVVAREADPAASKLPDGKGRDAVVEFCAGACHSSDRLLNARKTPQEWKQTVLQMVSNGAQLFPEDVDAVTQYLSDYMSETPTAKK